MCRLLALLIIALPVAAQAAGSDCRISETKERYEVICEGEPRAKQVKPPAEVEAVPVSRGKHRPQGSSMDNARAERMRVIREEGVGPSEKSDEKNPK